MSPLRHSKIKVSLFPSCLLGEWLSLLPFLLCLESFPWAVWEKSGDCVTPGSTLPSRNCSLSPCEVGVQSLPGQIWGPEKGACGFLGEPDILSRNPMLTLHRVQPGTLVGTSEVENTSVFLPEHRYNERRFS